MLLGMGFMQQRCFYINSHCDRMLWKEDLCHWRRGKTSGLIALLVPQQGTKAWRIQVTLKVMLWMKGKREWHTFGFTTSSLSEILMLLFVELGVSSGYSLMVFFLNLFYRPKYTFPPPVLTFRLCSKESQGSMTVGPTV